MNGTGLKIPAPQEIQRVTEEVLRRPEFGQLGTEAQKKADWLERFFEWLGLIRLFESGFPGTVLIRLLLIALLAALVFYLVRLLIAESGRLRRAPEESRLKASTVRKLEASSDELGDSISRAEQALVRDDTRSAVRLLYRAFIKLLSDKGFLKLECWKTNLVYLNECPKDMERYSLLQELTMAYNTIVYGHSPYDKEKITQLLSELRFQSEQG